MQSSVTVIKKKKRKKNKQMEAILNVHNIQDGLASSHLSLKLPFEGFGF